MRKRLVRFRHAVHIFFFLDGGAFAVRGIEQLVRQLLNHSLFAAAARIAHNPADRQRRPPFRSDFDRHLIVRAADAPRLHFEQRLRVLNCLREQLQSLVAALFLQLLERLIKNALGSRLLSLPHHRVDELRNQIRSIHRISFGRPLRDMSFSRHVCSVLSFHQQCFTGHWPLATDHWQLFSKLSSRASCRTLSALDCVPRPRSRRVFRALRDNARRADLSRGPRGSARSSAPAGCGRRPGYTSSLRFHWSGERAPPCAAPSSASSESGYTRAYTPRASADTIATPDSPSYNGSARGRISPVD